MYTLYHEIIGHSHCDYGFAFATWHEAMQAAREWAVEEWGEGTFNEIPLGFQRNELETIQIDELL